jgi:serine/threonine protein kinase
MTFVIGQNVGPYQIVAQLGQGGMATVYKAYHANLDRYVAIKVLHVAFKEDESFLERFKREAQIVAKLEHQHIVPVYDYADSEGQPYLVMKFIEGQTLKQYIRKKSPDLEEVTRILTAVADALDYAHRHDVLHRDVKPSNIVIDKNGVPYLTDFGLARIASRGESTLSQDMMVGTPQYISPEQAQGTHLLDAGTDIYSLGVVLYELVVGRVPFNADTPYAIIHDHIYKPLPLPSIVNPAVPEEVERVLLKSLAKKREDRFQTAGELATAFKKAIAASEMKEISHHTLRPEAFVASPPGTDAVGTSNIEVGPTPEAGSSPSAKSTPPPIATQAQYGWTVPHGHLPSSSSAGFAQPSAAIPGPIPPGAVLIPGSSVSQRQRSSGTAWVLLGCLILLVTCSLSAALVLNTVNDPKYKRDATSVSNVPAFDILGDEILQAARSDTLTTVQANQYMQDYPDEPSAHLALALMQLENGETGQAAQTFQRVLADLSPSAILIAQWAEVIAVRGFPGESMGLYLAAMSLDPTNTAIRNQAGSYIYDQASRATRRKLAQFCTLAQEYPGIAFVEAMLSQAMLSAVSDPAETTPETLCVDDVIDFGQASLEDFIKHSIELDDTLAEGYLVLGNYYEAVGNDEQAIENWTMALSLTGAPEWVRQRATEQNMSAIQE